MALAAAYNPVEVRMKSPGLAAMLSLFPGLGQFYNGQIIKGAAMMALIWLVGMPLTLFGVGFMIIGVVWLWSIVDAYHTAEKLNRRPHAIESCTNCGHSLIGVRPDAPHCPQCGQAVLHEPPSGMIHPTA
jgi:TM2 domain-containing membrane protein YozV